jgi:hypothetical protein
MMSRREAIDKSRILIIMLKIDNGCRYRRWMDVEYDNEQPSKQLL